MPGLQVCAIAQGVFFLFFFKEKFISSLKQGQNVWKCSKFLGKYGYNVASFCLCSESASHYVTPPDQEHTI